MVRGGQWSPVAEVIACASVLWMLRAAWVPIPLTVLSDSDFALGVVMGDHRVMTELPLSSLHGARLRTKDHAGNEAADRLAEAGRRRLMVPERAAALISCARPILPEPEQCSSALADRILGKRSATRLATLKPFWLGKQSAETVELTLGSAIVRTQLPAKRSAAYCSALLPCLGGVSASLTNSSRQGFLSWCIQETRCREQVRAEGLVSSTQPPTKRVRVVRAMDTARHCGRPQALSRLGCWSRDSQRLELYSSA